MANQHGMDMSGGCIEALPCGGFRVCGCRGTTRTGPFGEEVLGGGGLLLAGRVPVQLFRPHIRLLRIRGVGLCVCERAAGGRRSAWVCVHGAGEWTGGR